MKITDIRARILKPSGPYKYFEAMPSMFFDHVFVRVLTDEGFEGQCITFLMNPGEFEQMLPGLRMGLKGQDPHFVEAISQKFTANLERPGHVASTLDICLWDLIGKKHNEPIYRLLGAARNRMRAYASTITYETVEEYIQLALECKEQGFTALKMHAYGVPDKDIRLCRAIREAVGDHMELMLDPVNQYDRQGALKVGRALEDLNFTWLEAPILDTDIQGLVELKGRLNIAIAAAESAFQGLRAAPRYLTANALDAIRSVGDWMGGISAMRKIGAVSEAFNIKYEPHSYGPTLVQAAHFHIMLSILHCDFLEVPVPQGMWDLGMKDVIRIDPAGYVAAPTKPGLGYEVDMDQIDKLTIKQL